MADRTLGFGNLDGRARPSIDPGGKRKWGCKTVVFDWSFDTTRTEKIWCLDSKQVTELVFKSSTYKPLCHCGQRLGLVNSHDDPAIRLLLKQNLANFPVGIEHLEIDKFYFDMPIEALTDFLQKHAPSLKKLILKKVRFVFENPADSNEVEAELMELTMALRAVESLEYACVIVEGSGGLNETLLDDTLLSIHSKDLDLTIAPRLEWGIVREATFVGMFAENVASPQTFKMTVSVQNWGSLLSLLENILRNTAFKELILLVPPESQKDSGIVTAFTIMLNINSVLQNVAYAPDRATIPGPFYPSNFLASFFLQPNSAGGGSLLQARMTPHREDWLRAIIEYRQDVHMIYFLLTMDPSFIKDTGEACLMVETDVDTGEKYYIPSEIHTDGQGIVPDEAVANKTDATDTNTKEIDVDAFEEYYIRSQGRTDGQDIVPDEAVANKIDAFDTNTREIDVDEFEEYYIRGQVHDIVRKNDAWA